MNGTAVIASCGEALVDFVPGGADLPAAWQELLGGSPYNIARGLGRLGTPCAFVGAISTDFFGDELVHGLEDCGVSLEHVARLEQPTTLSFVRLDQAGPSYAFYSAEAADRHFAPEDPAALVDRFAALHFGSNSLALEPAATAFETLASAAAGRRLVSLDPNVRPRLFEHRGIPADRVAYLERIERFVALADVVKLSDEDLGFLDLDGRPEDAAVGLLRAGPALVVLTRGAQGSVAWTAAGVASAPAFSVEVVDTIGAGDGFMAGALTFLADHGLLDRGAISAMAPSALEAMLDFAGRVAAVVCTRRGADMPSRAELALLGR
jgi:fructokinase